jgi:hypothetical protein
MYVAYFDETGDDGYPRRSTDLFVLTSSYGHHLKWQPNYKKTYEFRKYLKTQFGLPLKVEWHTKHLLTNKKPYVRYNWDEQTRLKMCKDYAQHLAGLDIEFINVCINKLRINRSNRTLYGNVLDAALKFNVQRIQNTIKAAEPGTKFIIITDEGRVSSMQRTTRKIQKVNFVPSRYSPMSYRDEIKMLIEDPLPKSSAQSYFVQHCDFVSFFAYLKLTKALGAGRWHNRLSWMNESDVDEVLNILTPVLNLRANSRQGNFGFVVYPR